jgi:hypothetical protein
MIENTHRRAADPRLVAAIRAHKAALAAGAPAPRRFTVTMAPRVPAPPEPPPQPAPEPAPEPPPDPTPDTGNTPSSMFSAATAATIYTAREEVLRRLGVYRVGAMDHTNTGSEVTSRSVPTGKPTPPRWPDADAVYAARRRDVERARAAQHRRRE